MKIKSAEFIASAPTFGDCPTWALPEYALIGRSNVGKSSLLNMLAEKRDLARVSATPGKTQLINFFKINGTWSLVDLPGYGYAKVGKDKRLEFGYLVADFLNGRSNLKKVFILIDSRLEPQAVDIEFIRWIAGLKVQHALIFTKIDKQSPTKTRLGIEAFKQALDAAQVIVPEIFASSAQTKDGRSEIIRYIAAELDARKG